jgi:hypothetical protein
VFRGVAFFAYFLGEAEIKYFAGIPHQNQRAEGTKKVFLILLSAYRVKPASDAEKYAGFTRPTMIQSCVVEPRLFTTEYQEPSSHFILKLTQILSSGKTCQKF